jgi:hypothetical protein
VIRNIRQRQVSEPAHKKIRGAVKKVRAYTSGARDLGLIATLRD